jgi:hypothetical protein
MDKQNDLFVTLLRVPASTIWKNFPSSFHEKAEADQLGVIGLC